MSDAGSFERIISRLQETGLCPSLLVSRDGEARQALWDCEDGWIVGYTTERITGGPYHGRFAALAYRITGPGSRGGERTRDTEWERVYFLGFATRKAAKARATTMFYRHSPRLAAKHGVRS